MFTPKRPEATCLIFERRSSPKRTGSSPPSPVFDRPPIRFIATASVSCASRESEPSDIAPVEKRLTISDAGSTSSSGTPPSSANRKRSSPRIVDARAEVGVDRRRVLLVRLVAAVPYRVLQQRDRLGLPLVMLAAGAPCVQPDDGQEGVRRRPDTHARAARARRSASSCAPMPPMRDGVPVKYRSTSCCERPTASKICAPQYDGTVEIPILEIVFSRPLPIALTARARASAADRSSIAPVTRSSSVASIRYGFTAAAP